MCPKPTLFIYMIVKLPISLAWDLGMGVGIGVFMLEYHTFYES